MQRRSPDFASFEERYEVRARRHFDRVVAAFERLDG